MRAPAVSQAAETVTAVSQPATQAISNLTSGARQGFADFLIKNNLLSLTMAVTLGFATQDLIKSFVENIVSRFLEPIMDKDIEEKIVNLGPVRLRIGKFISTVIYYLMVVLVVYIFLEVFINKYMMNGKGSVN